MDITTKAKLPDVIKIDDITSGKIDPELIYCELERLKIEINILRNDMALFTKALASIDPNQSQHQYYNHITHRLKTVQNSIHEYCTQYNKLLPIINLSQIKLGNEVEKLSQMQLQSASNGASGPPNSNVSNGSDTVLSSVVNDATDSTTNEYKPSSSQSSIARNEKSPSTSGEAIKNGTNASQPIVL